MTRRCNKKQLRSTITFISGMFLGVAINQFWQGNAPFIQNISFLGITALGYYFTVQLLVNKSNKVSK